MTPLVTPGTFGSHQNTIYLGKHPSDQTRPEPAAKTTSTHNRRHNHPEHRHNRRQDPRNQPRTRPNPLTRELNTPQHAKTPAWGLRDHP